MDIVKQTERPLATINFVGEILEASKSYRRARRSVENRNEFLLPPKDCIPKEQLQEFIKDFTKSLGDVPLTKEEVEKEMNDFRNRRDAKTGG